MKLDPVELAKAAFQYGPFFFAVLFLVWMNVQLGRRYREVCQRKDPVASKQERSTHRALWIASFVIGAVLALIAVSWWLTPRASVYVFRGVIRDVKDYESISSERSVYFQAEPTGEVAQDGAYLRNVHFAAIQETPFTESQAIPLYFAKDRKRSGTWQVRCQANGAAYVNQFDPATGTNKLVRMSAAEVSSSLDAIVRWLWPSALAQGQAPPVPRATPSRGGPDCSEVKCRAAAILRSEKTVGGRILALEELSGLPDDELTACVLCPAGRDGVLGAVLALRSHSDPELAWNAQRISDRVPWRPALARWLSAPAPGVSKYAEDVLRQIGPADAEAVIADAAVAGSTRARLRRAVTASASSERPIATGSKGGDRFYVKAAWDPGNERVRTCLARLYAFMLVARRSVDEEARELRGKSERTVWWDYAVGAESMLDGIRRCGASGSYVRF